MNNYKSARAKIQFPKLSFTDRMGLLGYARYMGYDFDYDPKKRKAILVKSDGDSRTILYIVKRNNKLFGIDKEQNITLLNSEMNITKLLHDNGIFKMPENKDIGVNEYVLHNLKLVGIR